MEWKRIAGASNRSFKMLKSLKTKKGRDANGLFLVEGERAVWEAVQAGAPIGWFAASEGFALKHREQLDALNAAGAVCLVLEDGLFDSVCDTRTPQGLLCAVRLPDASLSRRLPERGEGLYVYCDHLADPGNAGTVIRTADAVGAAGVLFSEGSADVYSPKVVRATMGSLFHLPVYTGLTAADLAAFLQRGYRIAAGVLSQEAADYRSARLQGDVVLVVGNEANGVTKEVQELCSCKVIIPIAGKAESLNASVAAGILMYEWLRNTK